MPEWQNYVLMLGHGRWSIHLQPCYYGRSSPALLVGERGATVRPDKSRFYFGDSLKNCIWSYDYDLAGRSIRGEQPFLQGFERGAPDGSAIDAEGYVWNCRYGGSCIVRVAPDGKIDRVIELPVSNPTNCTFGGPNGNVLYVTSALPEAGHWERFGGCLFALETNVAGMAENKFQLP